MAASPLVSVGTIRDAEEIRQYFLIPVSKACLIEGARIKVVFEMGEFERGEAFGRESLGQDRAKLLLSQV